MELNKKSNDYIKLISNVKNIINNSKSEVYNRVNIILVKTYFEIGKYIVNYLKQNKEEEKVFFEKIARDLKLEFGKGFSRSNIIYMRLFYQKYSSSQTLSDQLSWSHYIELLTIDEDLERNFYEKQIVKENWSIRELKRQINSALFQRIALSKNKKEIIELSKKGNLVIEAKSIIKDPYILDFLNLKEQYLENDLESEIIDKLGDFLLELGKGFFFVKRQYRMSIGNNHYYIDLVFYHKILKCYVLIDLKIGKVSHKDIGQMNLYLNYFKKEEFDKGDNSPIGLVLGSKKDHIEVEFALGGITNQIFVSKYQLYLPNKEELQQQIKEVLKENK